MTETTLTAPDGIRGTEAPTPSSRSAAQQSVHRGDRYIWGIYVLLILVSVVELFSASSREINADSTFGVLGPIVRHGMLLLIGFGIMWFLQSRHYKIFIPATYLFVMLSVGLMVYVLFCGDIINGARRSTHIFGFQVQPAEFIKMSSVLVVSLVMARSQLRNGVGVSDQGMWISAIFVLFFGGLLVKQGLTNTLLLMVVSLSMMLIGGVKFKKMLLVLALYGVCGGGFVLWLGSQDEGDQGRLNTWTARLERFMGSPQEGDSIVAERPLYDQKITADNRQEMYSYMAQANGGITGVLPGNSREAARLPLAFSDFIFAIVVEDWGFIGGLLLLLTYLFLLGRGAGVASRCAQAYPALLVLGMALLIVFQALVHMIIVSGLGPVSGQPLPLISKGGSSIIVTSMALGIMLSVSKHAVRNRSKKSNIKREIEFLPEDVRAENPTQL